MATKSVRQKESVWADPRISFQLMMLTYVFGSAGVFLGIYNLSGGNAQMALHSALPLMVGAVGLVSLVRHSVFHKSDAARSDAARGSAVNGSAMYGGTVQPSPFFIIELGFANGAIGLAALAAFSFGWGVEAEVVIMLAYAIYLTQSFFLFFARVRKSGLDGGKILSLSMWAVQVIFMYVFAVAAAHSSGLPPF